MDLEKILILCGATFVFSLIVWGNVTDINQKNKIYDLVQKGKDPIGALCAVGGITEKTQSICTIYAQKEVKDQEAGE